MIQDIKEYKISNKLILVGLPISLAVGLADRGWQGFGNWIVGIILPIVLLFVIFCIGGLGAGDIKLLSVIGGYIGKDILIVICYSFFAGAILSILHQFYLSLNSLIDNKSQFSNNSKINKSKKIICFSVAILIGYGIYLGGLEL